MALDYSVRALINNIKRRCAVPEAAQTFTSEGFTLLANDTLQGEVVPLIMATREEMFVEHYDTPVPADGIIDFPDDTVGNKIRAVTVLMSGTPQYLSNVPRIDLDVVSGVGAAPIITGAGFYIEGNKMKIYPSNGLAGQTLRIFYYKRTLELADPANYSRIISIDTISNTVVVGLTPSDWEAGTVLNSVNGSTPFNVTNDEIEIVSINAPSIVLSSVEGLNVGDYLSVQGTSGVPQVPIEAQAYLAQLTAAKVLETLGDTQGMQNALAKAEQLKKNLLVMISQRVDGSVKKVINPNGGLRIGNGLRRWRGFGGNGLY